MRKFDDILYPPNENKQSLNQYQDFVFDELPGPSTSSGKQQLVSIVDSNEIDKNINLILDMFPDLAIDHLKQYLKYYENNPEQVINAIMENNLPPLIAENISDIPPIQPTQIQIKPIPGSSQSITDNLISYRKPNHKFGKYKEFDSSQGNSITKRYLENQEALSIFTNSHANQCSDNSDSEHEELLDEYFKNPNRRNVEYDDEYDDTLYETGFGQKNKLKPSMANEEVSNEDDLSDKGNCGRSKNKTSNPDNNTDLRKHDRGAVESSRSNKGGPKDQQSKHAYKEINKAKMGNHDRKFQNLQKLSKGGYSGR